MEREIQQSLLRLSYILITFFLDLNNKVRGVGGLLVTAV